MKTLILILLLIILLDSCKKDNDPVFCWKCQYAYSYKGGSYSYKEYVTECDNSESEIRKYEKDKYTTDTFGDNSDIWTTVTCVKQ